MADHQSIPLAVEVDKNSKELQRISASLHSDAGSTASISYRAKSSVLTVRIWPADGVEVHRGHDPGIVNLLPKTPWRIARRFHSPQSAGGVRKDRQEARSFPVPLLPRKTQAVIRNGRANIPELRDVLKCKYTGSPAARPGP